MAVKKSAMHSQRNRTDNAGGNAFAGDWCHYAGARVHGGKHVSGPENQEQYAGNDQRHEDKEVGDCSDLHVSEPLAWVVMEDAIKNRQGGFDQPGHGVGEVVHSHLRLAALGCLDQLGPDSLPVVRAEVLPRDGAARVQLKSRSQFRRTWAQPVHHIPEMPPGRATVNGEPFALVHRLGSEEFFQVHTQITPHGVAACQHQQV